jgi:hypothetical protein
MQSTDVYERHHDTASLVPEWPSAMEDRSYGLENDHLARGRPSIVMRVLRSLSRFSIAVLIGVGVTLTWQSYGDKAREMLTTQFPSLGWLSISTTTFTPDGQGSAQNAAVPQSGPIPQTAAPAIAAAPTPEFTQLEPMARDLAAMRRSLEQLAVKQEQMTQNIATLQATEQEIKKKISSRPLAQTISDQPRKPPKSPGTSSPAQSPPVPGPPAVAQSPSQ